MSSTPEKQAPEDRGQWIGAIFLVFVLVLAILFTVYVLAWDGGGNT